MTAQVLPYVADHQGILAKLSCAEILEREFEHEVWHLNAADWDTLEEAIRSTEWRALCSGTAEDALAYFQETLCLLIKYISKRKVRITKRSHLWLNERNQKAITRKIPQRIVSRMPVNRRNVQKW